MTGISPGRFASKESLAHCRSKQVTDPAWDGEDAIADGTQL
jgi:hypothetical protein